MNRHGKFVKLESSAHVDLHSVHVKVYYDGSQQA